MKRIAGYIMLALVSYLVFVAMTFPAQRALSMALKETQGVFVGNVSGTVWDGRISHLQVAGQDFHRVKWELELLPMMWGQLALNFSFDGEGRAGTGVLGLNSDGSITLESLKARVPVAEIDQYLNLAPIKFGGMADLQFEHLAILGNRITAADGVLLWQQSGTTAPTSMQLGDLSATLSTGEDGIIQGVIKDEGENGPLELEGIVKLQPDGKYELRGKLRARDSAGPDVARGISILGRQGNDGRIALEFDGAL